jgi:endonuclease/exonuclease/phosphatase family metal-dependent hydrolase
MWAGAAPSAIGDRIPAGPPRRPHASAQGLVFAMKLPVAARPDIKDSIDACLIGARPLGTIYCIEEFSMRIAAFNVENLFDRAMVFSEENKQAHRQVLDAHAEINKLFEKEVYSDADKARMLELLGKLGLLRRDEGLYAILRKIRGRLITRPRGNKKPSIAATRRDTWVGWVELKTEPVDEIAMANTARVIRDVGADVLAIVEAESRPVLKKFHDMMLKKLSIEEGYRHIMIIDGNDDRGIDVGLATRNGYEIGTVRSHVDDLKPDGNPIFSRDSPEYEVATPSGERLVVVPNHFKSKFGGNDPTSRAKRLAQARAAADIYRRLRKEGAEYVVVLGDLNDVPDSEELAPLLAETDLRDVSRHKKFTEFEFRADNGHRGIGTHQRGNDDEKIDYILLSPALFSKITKGGIFRKGAWPGRRPQRWDVYPELKAEQHAASDHHAIWADIDI